MSEGAGSKGTVLKDFLSSGDSFSDSTFASALVPGRSTPPSTSSEVPTIKKRKTAQMDETIDVSVMRRINIKPCTGKSLEETKTDSHGDLSRRRIVGGL
jgi:hypothetical protein